MFQQDGGSWVEAGANLKEHLSSKTAEELNAELDSIFEKEAREGIKADPKLVNEYFIAIEKKTQEQQTQVPGSFEESWATFTKNHPDLFPKEKAKPRNHTIRLHRVVEAIVLAATILVLSAAAFQWPDHVITWGKELLHISPAPSGNMELPEPNADGYSTLAEAANDLGPGEISVPSWIPDTFSLDNIVVQDASSYKVVTAIYIADEGRVMIRVAYYYEVEKMPDFTYEKTTSEKQKKYTRSGIEHFFVENFDRYQATWKNGNYLYSISGNISEKELERMVNSIYGG